MTVVSFLVVMVLGGEAPPLPETWTVVAGDTCASIAQRFYGDARQYDRLHALNALGPLPHNLKPGTVLRLRAAEALAPAPDEAQAQLTFLKPAVRTRHLVDWNSAVLGMDLFRLDEVNTLKGAGAEITFRDTSSVVLEERALVVITAESNPRRPSSGIALADGELRVALAQLRTEALAVKTPAAELSLRAGPAEGVASVDTSQTARLSLFEGRAEVKAGAVTVQVPAGHGTRVRLGEAPEAAQELPAQPVLETKQVVALAREGGVPVTVSWQAVDRAISYRVQLARDGKYIDRVAELETSAREATFDGLEVGRYLVRVIAFDVSGLQSRPSVGTAVVVVGIAGRRDERAVWVTKGTTPAVQVPSGFEVRVDGATPAPLSVGLHRLEVTDPASTTPWLVVILAAPPPAPVVTREGRGLRLTFADELPVTPEVSLQCGERPVPLKRADARSVTGLPELSGTCVVSWYGRELTRFDRI
jgi:hypothetical protein